MVGMFEVVCVCVVDVVVVEWLVFEVVCVCC